MNFRNPAFALIIVSLIAAGAILAASAWLEDTSQTVTYIIIAVWWIPFSILTARSSRKSKDEADG